MSAALDVRGLSYRYQAGFGLDGIGFEVQAGAFTVLLGPNGAGKTTLVCLLTRLFTPTEGDILVGGRSLLSEPGAALARLGVVFQQPSLDLDLTVNENLRYAASLNGLGRKEASSRIDAELQRLGMSDRRREPVRRLSGGYRRRLEVARALLHRPSLLICDEATVGLDLAARAALLAHVRSLCADEGLAVLWTTHLTEEVAADDRVLVMQAGKLRPADRAEAFGILAGGGGR